MNFATSKLLVKTKQRLRPIVVYLCITAIGFQKEPMVCGIYIHGVGLSALLDSTNRGNAKAYTAWNELQTRLPRFFCIIATLGSGRHKNNMMCTSLHLLP